MPRMNNSERIKSIEGHIDVINKEMGGVQQDIATIKTNFSWMRWIISGNVLLWVVVLGKLIVG